MDFPYCWLAGSPELVMVMELAGANVAWAKKRAAEHKQRAVIGRDRAICEAVARIPVNRNNSGRFPLDYSSARRNYRRP